jgi:hypothetical protein
MSKSLPLAQRQRLDHRRRQLIEGGAAHDVHLGQTGVGGALGRLGGRAGPGDQRPGAGVRELVAHFGRAQHHVQRHHDRAGLEDAVVDDRKLRDVGQLKGDGGARSDTAGDQCCRHGVGAGVQFGVGDDAAVVHQRRRVRPRGGRLTQDHG